MDKKPIQKAEEPLEELMHDLSPKKEVSTMKIIVILLIVSLLGVGTGFLISKTGVGAGILPGGATATTAGGIQKGKIYGSNDTKTFKDVAEGVLKEGGVEGEGQFHLVRPGGESQNVYLTSSLVDLSEFKGKKVKVWGQTMAAQTAGWLMDVGRVQVL
ncbi:MAG: hypothetical protein RLZZ455_1018 [Candidatus Parcubacteria bacterium]